MRLHRPVLAGLALGAVLPVTAASAATGVSAAGSAVSTATLATISVGALADVVDAQTISLGSLASIAESAKTPSVSFVPITQNGVQTGKVTVTPANSPQTVGALAAAPNPLLAATSPGATLTAADGSKKSSGLTSSLGSASLLGMPLDLGGSVQVGSVTDGAHAHAGKALTLTGVELPNLADLLKALGIDITALPVDTLNGLINELHLTLTLAEQQALDAKNTAIDTLAQAADDAETALTAAEEALTDAETDFEEALATIPAGNGGPMTIEQWNALTDLAQTAIIAVVPAVGTTETAFNAAGAAVDTADAALEDAITALIEGVVALAEVVNTILAGVPLAKIGEAKVATLAEVGTAKDAAVTGYVDGVEVLGTDLLAEITGSSKLDLAKLAGETAAQVNAALNTIGTALSEVLSGATGATGLVVPAPKIELLKKTTKTGTDGAFGTASATVSTLSISLGSATIPTEFALENAPDLANLAPIADGFQTAPLSVKVGTLSESARFAPGGSTPATPNTPNKPDLASTGGPAGLAVLALIGTGLAVVTRRRLRSES
jgi:hypothetical protein